MDAYTFLQARKRVRYETLIGHVLQTSLIFEADVKDFVHDLAAEGSVIIEGMTGKQRRVGAGHEIVFKGRG